MSNEALLNSLENDLHRYSREPIPISKPNLIVVSGDLIKGLEEEDPLDQIYMQYDEAANFLSRLADIFLDGDKEQNLYSDTGRVGAFFRNCRGRQERILCTI